MIRYERNKKGMTAGLALAMMTILLPSGSVFGAEAAPAVATEVSAPAPAASAASETPATAKENAPASMPAAPATAKETPTPSETPAAAKESPKVVKAAESGIKWYPYDEGMAMSRKDRKKVFLNFYADWCQYCKVMKEKTFTQAEVIQYLNDHYVAIQVDSDRNRQLAQRYSVTGLPLSWFISETGDNIGSQPGYLEAGVLMSLLKYIHTDSYKSMNFKKFVESNP